MKQALVFLANGFEEVEAITPIDVLRRAEINVKTVSISDTEYVTGAHDIAVKADATLNNVSFSEADLLLLPGGMPGALNLDSCSELKKQLVKANNQGKYVAAICAAPMVLGGLGLLKDKAVTCYPGFEDKLIGAKVKSTPVEVDGNIVTGRGAGVSMDFALALVALLKTPEEAKDLAQKMVVK